MNGDEKYWQDVRNNAAINALNSLLSNSFTSFVLEYIFKKKMAQIAVKYADELVKELKSEESNGNG